MKKTSDSLRHRTHRVSSFRGNTFDSTGPDGKVRGTAKQLFEKYLALGRDAMSSSDRTMAERFFQHAEHYRRVVSEKEAVAGDCLSKRRTFPPQDQQVSESSNTDVEEVSSEDAPRPPSKVRRTTRRPKADPDA